MNKGVKPVLSSSRFYPYADNLVHTIVGYIGQASLKDIERMDTIRENLVQRLKGKSGIEYSNEKLLIGKYGIKRYEVNSPERISQIDHIKETQGTTIKTTVDLVQTLLKNY